MNLSSVLTLYRSYLKGALGTKQDHQKNGTRKITHLFFVDNLKTYAQDLNDAKFQLDLVTTFTRDIGMEFGIDKCAYIYIERGKKKTLGENLTIQGTELKELDHGEQYKYLGQEESVGYNAELNKERVVKEYFKRVRKIWGSELYSNTKLGGKRSHFKPSGLSCDRNAGAKPLVHFSVKVAIFC